MNKLLVIKEKDVYPEVMEQPGISYEERTAARAVLFDAAGNIAILHVRKHGYYKLPGGGVDAGEEIMSGLARECMEETGCNIVAGDEIGIVEEYRDRVPLHQLSYCYFAKVSGPKGVPAFVGDEIDDSFELVWMSVDDAIRAVGSAVTEDYNGKFIQIRDLAYLQKAKSLR
jgi:8-oxo-dGTP pyrophosphatase MutT (NUDIX family)